MPTPFALAVKKIGGPAETARKLALALGRTFSRQSVARALKAKPERCPDGWALVLSEHSGIPRSHLRPDVYPPRSRIEGAAVANA